MGAGLIRHITLAPELPGAMEAIGLWAAQGTTVAIGHTNADFSTSLAAFDAGATVLTHAFNAMNGLHHRAPGPVAAAIRRDGVTLEIVNDGVHVHPEVVRLAFTAAPGRVALVSDAMAAAGAEDGEYRLGALSVTVRGNRAVLTQGGALAGSTLTLDAALAHAVNVVGLDIAAAALALTEIPAQAIGYGHRLGKRTSGYDADAVLLDTELEVQGMWAAGSRLRWPKREGLLNHYAAQGQQAPSCICSGSDETTDHSGVRRRPAEPTGTAAAGDSNSRSRKRRPINIAVSEICRPRVEGAW